MKKKIQTISASALIILFLQSFILTSISNGKTLPPHPLFGVTIENLDQFDLTQLRNLLNGQTQPLTIRVIFQNKMLPSAYEGKLDEIRRMNPEQGTKKIYVLGTLYDSDYLARYRIKYPLKPEGKLNCDKLKEKTTDYQLRTFCFVDKLDKYVDIWEVGNEVNGEWADEGCKKKNGVCKSKDDESTGKHLPASDIFPRHTIDKIEYAIKLARQKDKPIALTLLHQPKCTTWDDNDMFLWSDKISLITFDRVQIIF
jgi:hypothetical protein